MKREDVTFRTDGSNLKGHFCTPDGVKPPYPTVVMARGTNNRHQRPIRLAPYFPANSPCFSGEHLGSIEMSRHSHSIISQPSSHLFSLVFCGVTALLYRQLYR